MDETLNTINGIIPPKYQFLIGLSLILGRVIQAIRNGGGLKSIIASVWLGTNTPKAKTQEEPGIADKLTGLLLIGVLSFGAMTAVTGCTTPQTREAIVFNSFKDAWTVAHAAYQAHCENVVNGKVNKEKEAKVDAEWNKFRLVFKASLSVAHQDWSKPAPATLDAAEQQLLLLIRTL
jgi:hypothetical protein